MSKKQQQRNRLTALFSTLEDQAQPIQAAPPAPSAPAHTLSGWTWETDSEGNYIACSADLATALGLPPDEFNGRPLRTHRLHPAGQAALAQALISDNFPQEVGVQYRHNLGHWINARIHILGGSPAQGEQFAGWRGFSQLLPGADGDPTAAKHDHEPQAALRPAETHRPPEQQAVDPSDSPSLSAQPLIIQPAAQDQPAELAVSIQAGPLGELRFEVFDETPGRIWSEDERQLVSEVASQLALALENARLYQAVQLELAERQRAEKIVLQRNQDLATLNQIGQRMSQLVSRAEIYTLLGEFIDQVIESSDYSLCIHEPPSDLYAYPLYIEGGIPYQIEPRLPSGDLSGYIIKTRLPLLLSGQVAERLHELGITPSDRTPSALIALPLLAGETLTGALVIQDFSQTPSPEFDDAHMELLSTALAQAATALENARLFEQMQLALRAIEKRERYQAGVAQAAGRLSEYGIEAFPTVLELIGEASQADQVYLLEYHSDDRASSWKQVSQWAAPDQNLPSIPTDIPYETLSGLINTLRVQGWAEIQSNSGQSAIEQFLKDCSTRSALVLGISGRGAIPSLLFFSQVGANRRWLNDEIGILQVAADAIANTYIREDLLAQLRLNLQETESLYKATNQFVLSGNFQDMLAALMETLQSPDLNRAMLILFERDAAGAVTEMTVHANWYSGAGARPPFVGSLLPAELYEHFLRAINPVFLDTTISPTIDKSVRAILYEQNIHSLALLPLWSGKRQMGALLAAGEHKHNFSGRETRILPPLAAQLTIAVENLRLFEQTQAALSETAALYDVSSAIAQAQSADDMVRLVVDSVLPRGADKAAIMLAEYAGQDEIRGIEIVGFLDTTGKSQMKGMRLKLDDLPVISRMTDDGLMTADVNDVDAASRATLASCGVKAIVFVPLLSGSRLIGLLSASCRSPMHFNHNDVRVLRTVANGIAVALEKQRLLREAQRRALELQTASEIARDTASTLSPDILLNRIVNLLSERFAYYHASIYLIDETHTFAVLSEASGEIGTELKRRGHRLLLGSRSIIGAVSSTGETLILNDVHSSPLYLPHPLLPDTQAEIALPLRISGRIIGVLDIQSHDPSAFAPEDASVLGILTDQIAIAIENARAYELAQKAIEDMREVDRVKTQFLANMSHELRTPLNSIIGFSRVILKGIDGPTTEMQQQDLNAIYSSGQHLLLLINDILDLSKIEAGKMDLSFSDVNIGDMITSAMSTAVGLVKDKPIQLSSKIPPNLPMLRADATRVRQVLINFLSNAAKFTEQGFITVEARVDASPQGQPEVMVTVTDSGPGIAENDRAKLFLPFSQVDDSPTRKTGGSGLGLSICRSLIEMHGGRIGLLNSEPGEGSTFFFSLPVQTSANNQAQQPGSPGLTAPLVLSIDDDLQVINLYQRYLQPQGSLVQALTDPFQAVETARRLHPLAITLDVMMPGRNGWQVMQDLKSDPQTRNIPVIVCSLIQDEQKGFDLGATDYLVKPFLQEELLNSLHRINQADAIQSILLIDDNPDDLRLIEKMLAVNPLIHVRMAQGGETGLAQARTEKPDAILLDLQMPELDGFEVLDQLRADPLLAAVPVIILSGADLTPEQHARLTSLGSRLLAKAYLREKELLNSLEETLERILPQLTVA